MTKEQSIDFTLTPEACRMLKKISQEQLEQYLQQKEQLEEIIAHGIDWERVSVNWEALHKEDEYRDLLQELVEVGANYKLDRIEESIMHLKEVIDELERCGY